MSKTATSCNTLKWSNLSGGFSNTFMPIRFDGYSYISGEHIWTDGTNIYYSYGDRQYVLNGNTWEKKTWKGLTNFDGFYIWTDGTNIYYSYSDSNYVLNGDTWEPKIWKGLTTPNKASSFMFIWTDGTDIYTTVATSGDFPNYVLNKETDTWEEKENWSGFNICFVWTDGTNIYKTEAGHHLVLNKETDTWESKTWDVNDTSHVLSLAGTKMWTDGTNVYCGEGFILNKETDVWEYDANRFNSLSVEDWHEHLWTDGVNIYVSHNGDNYILCPTTAALYQCEFGEWKKIINLV